jgi:DNA-binding GntR family transcriptional regulator
VQKRTLDPNGSSNPQHVENVHDLVRAAILSGDIPAGQITTQAALVEQLNVGRTPLREALRKLQKEGLVVSERNQKLQIAGLTGEDAEELYVMRIALETAAIRLTVPTLDADSFAELEGLMAKMDHYMRIGNQPGMRTPHWQFHEILIAGAGARARRGIAELFDHGERYRLQYGSTIPWDKRRQEHRDIVDAAAAGDAELAAETLAAHYLNTAQLIFAVLDPGHDLRRLRALLETVAPRTAKLLAA